MGNQLLDQYSLLHYASGVIAYFWGFEPLTFFLAHVGFELAENTSVGMRFINQHLTWWPGGKPRADNIVNMLGDNLAAAAGYWCAFYIDSIGKKKAWYKAV